MKILAIETSCDETSLAVVENGTTILSNIISSQIKAHREYGGVVPELASRMHAEKINKLLDICLEKAALTMVDMDAVAVTCGPGLEGALIVGMTMAKTIAVTRKLPLIGVNHLHGHMYAQFLAEDKPAFPYIALLVSGGHTQVILVNGHFDFQLLGTTRDDAAGEAFDKVARFIDLGYPGGPVIEKTAREGSETAFRFPRAMINRGYEFSFSGLKTAVIQQVLSLRSGGDPLPVADICASFQKAVVDVLLKKCLKACEEYKVNTLLVSGGVSANGRLRDCFQQACEPAGIRFLAPSLALCTDNAAMIGAAAYFQYKLKGESALDIRVKPNLEL